jgi:hypothetical protein
LSNLSKGIHNAYYIGQIPDPNSDPEQPAYLDGFHADIHAKDTAVIEFPDWITLHNPEHPVHLFG